MHLNSTDWSVVSIWLTERQNIDMGTAENSKSHDLQGGQQG